MSDEINYREWAFWVVIGYHEIKRKNTTLYLYEFNVDDFILQDDVAGYYVATTTQIPIAKYQLNDLFSELVKQNIEIRITDNLWDIANEVKASTLNWSLCRMDYAQSRS